MDKETGISVPSELGGTHWSKSFSGLHFQNGGLAMRGFFLRVDTLSGQNLEHARLEEVGPIQATIDGGGTRRKQSELEAVLTSDIVLGNHSTNVVIGQRLSEAMAGDHEGICIDNLGAMRIEVTRDTRSIVGTQGRALDPSPIGLGEVLGFSQERGKMCNFQIQFVNPIRQSVLGGSGEFLDGCVVRGCLRTRTPKSAFLDRPRRVGAGNRFSQVILNFSQVSSLERGNDSSRELLREGGMLKEGHLFGSEVCPCKGRKGGEPGGMIEMRVLQHIKVTKSAETQMEERNSRRLQEVGRGTLVPLQGQMRRGTASDRGGSRPAE